MLVAPFMKAKQFELIEFVRRTVELVLSPNDATAEPVARAACICFALVSALVIPAVKAPDAKKAAKASGYGSGQTTVEKAKRQARCCYIL